MKGLKPFRTIPENILDWTRWMSEQTIPDPTSDSILRGTASFNSRSFALVMFSSDEVSADYAVMVENIDKDAFWITDRTVSGFTVNSSGTETATVNWVLFR